MNSSRNCIRLAIGLPLERIFHPLFYRKPGDVWVLGCAFQGLVAFDEKFQLQGRLGEVAISPDGREYHVRLHSGLFWHDGQPVTAHDVAFTYRSALDPHYVGNRGVGFMSLAGAELYKANMSTDLAGIAIHNDRELTLRLMEPQTSFMHHMLLPIIPRHVFGDCPVPEMPAHPATVHPVGCGPYKLIESSDGLFKFQRHERFHLGCPQIEYMEILFTTHAKAIDQVLAGQTDFCLAQPSDLDRLRQASGLRICHWSQPYYEFIGINHRHPLLGQRSFRQALAYAIDRRRIVNELLHGYADLMHHPITPISLPQEIPGINPYLPSQANVDALLAASGCRRLPSGQWAVGEEPIVLSLAVEQGYDQHLAVARYVQQDLITAGLGCNLQESASSEFVARNWTDHTGDLWIAGRNVSLDPDPAPFFGRHSRWVHALGWSNSDSLSLIAGGNQLADREKRIALYTDWCRLANRELPILPLYSPHELQIVTEQLLGLRPDPRGALWNIHELRFGS